jgi:serine/threonine protein kinase
MHSKKVCHRDLKPENILIQVPEGNQSRTEGQMQVKICDLGAAKVLDNSEGARNTPYVVSRYYRAPELIMGSNKYDLSIDIWAAGCVLFELITRTPLFPGEEEGIQILEQATILGKPNEEEFSHLKKQCAA